ncbi:MAG: HNH endonuclease [Candidatus ainarchaeum sp.]|nr:HNH endonuclease [Candidatus ainarchaeum sp.]
MGWFFTDKKGYKRSTTDNELIHRKVASKKLGRTIGEKEVVHHLNRNKLDNRPSNLYVFKSQNSHNKAHKKDDWW